MDRTYAGRREDARLVTGAGRYTADWSLPNEARAVFVRSDMAHARIGGIDTAAALAAPGVLGVLTGADAEAAGYVRNSPALPATGRDGPLKAPVQPVIATWTVRHVGELVAVVVAETEAEAKDAAELLEIDWEVLDAVSDPADALAEDAPQLDPETPGNVAFDGDYGDHPEVDAAFAKAAHVARVQLESQRVIGNPMEPKAAIAAWDGDMLDIWAPNQGGNPIVAALARCTGTAFEKVRLHSHDVGGTFGVRGEAYPEYIALALAAKTVGRPVRWQGTRSETFVSDYHGRGLRMTAELALDADGRFLAIRHDWLVDLGGYPMAAGPLTPVMNSTYMCAGAYHIPAVAGRNRLVLTNRTPVTAYRGAARPDMAYAVERVVDEAARITGIDRIELRRRNMLLPDDFPVNLPHAIIPGSYDSGDFGRLLDRAAALSDWSGFEARRDEAKTRGRLRGMGCALFVEPAGGGSPTDQAAIQFTEGGIRIFNAAQNTGQSHETVFPILVAEALDIPADRITLTFQDQGSPVTKGGGSFGSRSLSNQGTVFVTAAAEVLDKARKLAGEALGGGAVSYSEGIFTAEGTNRSMSLEDLAAANPGALDTLVELPSNKTFPSGCHVAEVEIDPETGVVEIARYISVDDCGTVFDPVLVEGQIHGGLMQGLGQVFGEIAAYDTDGQLLTGSFMDYMMPRADLALNLTIELAGTPSPRNPLGAKGVGEAGTVGSLPTMMNAILDALRPAGIEAFDMPASPGRVWEALHAAE